MELLSVIFGGLIGGIIGVIGTLVSSYYGPRKMEEWKAKQLDDRINGPRKRLLKSMLEDARFNDGRSIETLSFTIGSKQEECRNLLVEIGARGIRFGDGREGWVLLAKRPIDDV